LIQASPESVPFGISPSTRASSQHQSSHQKSTPACSNGRSSQKYAASWCGFAQSNV